MKLWFHACYLAELPLPPLRSQMPALYGYPPLLFSHFAVRRDLHFYLFTLT